MCILEKPEEDAVSPVVGVMLMLVVTIIIAAVVSAFAGGLTSGTEKAPTASFQCRIANDGTWGGSTFDLTVLGMEPSVQTKDIKITTSWKASDGTNATVSVTGPNATIENPANTHYTTGTSYHSPLGFGPGVNQSMFSGNYYPDQHFGNYSLMAGTRMHNSAYGWSVAYGGYGVDTSTRYQYTDGSNYVYGTDMDAMQAILGREWYHLRPGDIVHVKVVHVPSAKVIYDADVAVEG